MASHRSRTALVSSKNRPHPHATMGGRTADQSPGTTEGARKIKNKDCVQGSDARTEEQSKYRCWHRWQRYSFARAIDGTRDNIYEALHNEKLRLASLSRLRRLASLPLSLCSCNTFLIGGPLISLCSVNAFLIGVLLIRLVVRRIRIRRI